jgi:leucyl aminopeptidase (aminopeptidase T)
MTNTLDAIDVDYQKIDREGKRLSNLLKRGKKLKVKDDNGTDIEMEMSRVPPHLYSGIMSRPLKYSTFSSVMNIPGSELDFVPKAKSVEGAVYFDRPIFQDNKKLEGLQWTFKKGRLVEYSAKNNASLFGSGYEAAKGDKDMIGALTIGLNPKLLYGFNQDFWVRGSLTLGIGSLGEGDRNKTEYSFTGTLSKATLSIDGAKIIEAGKLSIA